MVVLLFIRTHPAEATCPITTIAGRTASSSPAPAPIISIREKYFNNETIYGLPSTPFFS